MILNCKFHKDGVQEQLILNKFGITKSMQLMVCFSNIPNNVKKVSNGELPFWSD